MWVGTNDNQKVTKEKIVQRLRSANMAHVAQKNTPETDAMERVEHVVKGTGSDGAEFTVTVAAREPMDATEVVATMSEEDFQGLLRKAAHRQ